MVRTLRREQNWQKLQVGQQFSRSGRGHYRAAHRILDQLGVTPDLEVLHHRVLVECNGAWRDVEDKGDLFHRAPFRQ